MLRWRGQRRRPASRFIPGYLSLPCQAEAFNCALQARKDATQRSLEARLRNARFLAELTKFRLVPFGAVFSLLKSLLDDFVGHNVDAAAALVETAGRFLYRLPETQTRMANMLEVMLLQSRAV